MGGRLAVCVTGQIALHQSKGCVVDYKMEYSMTVRHRAMEIDIKFDDEVEFVTFLTILNTNPTLETLHGRLHQHGSARYAPVKSNHITGYECGRLAHTITGMVRDVYIKLGWWE